MKLSAVLFDMDGLLFDTERVAGNAARMACREMGVTMRREILTQLYGGNPKNGETVMKKYFGADFDFPRYTTLAHGYMQQLLAAEGGLRAMPGAQVFLRWLKRQGLPAVVASSSKTETIRHNLRVAGFTSCYVVTPVK